VCDVCSSFDRDNRFARVGDGAIRQDTIVAFDPQSGYVIRQFGNHMYVVSVF